MPLKYSKCPWILLPFKITGCKIWPAKAYQKVSSQSELFKLNNLTKN